MKSQWDLKLNETLSLGNTDYCYVRLVQGGWIYVEYSPVEEKTEGMVFVPYVESEKWKTYRD